jgi:membrane protease YdiL (CAAX protease family)
VIASPAVAYLSYHSQPEILSLLIIISYLLLPAVTAVSMVYLSKDSGLIKDFWIRLGLFRIGSNYLIIIVFLMPSVITIATLLSLLFGYSSDQFFLARELSMLEGWSVLGILIPLLIAPFVEELAWRGYGVDSLMAYNNLFTSSAIFGVFWSSWHLPLVFLKGSYQNQLYDLGLVYVINFFVSIFALSFLLNWIYYKVNRSIPAIILFHFVINLSAMFLNTQPFTKCIVTVLLILVVMFIFFRDKEFFLKPNRLVA